MSAVKIMFVVFFCTFGLLFGIDLTRFYLAYDAISKGLSQSVDAGLIAGTDDTTRALGELQLNMDATRIAVRDVLKNNLSLDDALQNDNFKNSQLDIQLIYTNGNPRLEAVFSTHLSLVAGKMIGLPEYPLKIPKRTPYLSIYK